MRLGIVPSVDGEDLPHEARGSQQPDQEDAVLRRSVVPDAVTLVPVEEEGHRYVWAISHQASMDATMEEMRALMEVVVATSVDKTVEATAVMEAAEDAVVLSAVDRFTESLAVSEATPESAVDRLTESFAVSEVSALVRVLSSVLRRVVSDS
jgi:hypothetical protein